MADLRKTAVSPHTMQGAPAQAPRGLAQTALDPLRRAYEAYQRSIGQPFQQAVRGGVRGYFGLPLMSDASATGREAYRQGEALGYTPGVGMPAGAVRVAAEGVQALPELATFIGAAAKTWNAASNAKAVQMEKAGVSPQVIWRETGNWRAPDGEWRQEISDKDVKFVGSEATAPANVVMPHEQLAAAYPDVMQTPVTLRPNRTTSTMTSNEAGAKIDLGTLDKEKPSLLGLWGIETGPKSPLLHELQHVIQRKEGFARGGTPEASRIDNPYPPQLMPIADEYRELWRSLKGQNRPKSPVGLTMRSVDIDDWFDSLDQVDDPKIRQQFFDILNKLDIERQNLFGLDEGIMAQQQNIETYRRLAGEAEARATQNRIMMTEEQRRAKFPLESYDVPLEELIIRK
jgi:hypothetical protein